MNNAIDHASMTTTHVRACGPISTQSTNNTIRTDKTLAGNPTTIELILALALGALFLGTSLFMLIYQDAAFSQEAPGYQSNRLASTSQNLRRANHSTKAHSATLSEREAMVQSLNPTDNLNLNTPTSAPAALK